MSGTIRWEDGEFFFEHLDGRVEPTRRPYSWASENSERRILAALKRKGYKPDPFNGPQLWGGGIGYTMYVVSADGPPEDDQKFVFGDTLTELRASINRLPLVCAEGTMGTPPARAPAPSAGENVREV